MATVNGKGNEAEGPSKARSGEWLSQGWSWFVEDIWYNLLMGLLLAVIIGVSNGFLWGPALVASAAVGLRRAKPSPEKEGIEDSWSLHLQDDLSAGIYFFLPSFISGILIGLFSLVGLIFLIVPGLVIFAMYLFTFHFIADRKQDFWKAMESSRQIVARDYFGFTLFAVLLLLINLAGIFFFVAGVIPTLMITSLAVTAAYRESQGWTPVEPAVEKLSEPVVIE